MMKVNDAARRSGIRPRAIGMKRNRALAEDARRRRVEIEGQEYERRDCGDAFSHGWHIWAYGTAYCDGHSFDRT